MKDAIRVDTAELRRHVDEAVRSSVEETLNALLQAEAEQICKAGRYACSPERVDTRAGHYERKLETKAGAVVLKMPKLRSLPYETAIIERYRRREASVEEALVQVSGFGRGHESNRIGRLTLPDLALYSVRQRCSVCQNAGCVRALAWLAARVRAHDPFDLRG